MVECWSGLLLEFLARVLARLFPLQLTKLIAARIAVHQTTVGRMVTS